MPFGQHTPPDSPHVACMLEAQLSTCICCICSFCRFAYGLACCTCQKTADRLMLHTHRLGVTSRTGGMMPMPSMSSGMTAPKGALMGYASSSASVWRRSTGNLLHHNIATAMPVALCCQTPQTFSAWCMFVPQTSSVDWRVASPDELLSQI